jgi:hypothetical protein
MSKRSIQREIEGVRKRIEKMPRIWKFRGRRVVPAEKWKLEDWTTFPDEYHIGFEWLKPPADYWKDYEALLRKLEDPTLGQILCYQCAINNAQQVGETIERFGWDHRGGEKAREEFYKTCPPSHVIEYRREDAMRQTQFRLYNEAAGANKRTCNVLNYFKCPYGEERDQLTDDGYQAEKLWEVVEWYNKHWNPCHYSIPAEWEKKWYHRSEPSIIDVTNLDDILKATEDGRLKKITEEYERYNKEISY